MAYLLPHLDGHGGIHFVLANVGRGPAFNVTFELEYDDGDFEAHHVMLLNDPQRSPISVLPQDEKIRSLMGISFQLYGKVGSEDIGPLRPFKVRTTFHDVTGRKLIRERMIDIRQFSGLLGVLEESNERKISKSLDRIDNNLASIAKQSSRFSAFVDITQFSDTYKQKTKGSHDL